MAQTDRVHRPWRVHRPAPQRAPSPEPSKRRAPSRRRSNGGAAAPNGGQQQGDDGGPVYAWGGESGNMRHVRRAPPSKRGKSAGTQGRYLSYAAARSSSKPAPVAGASKTMPPNGVSSNNNHSSSTTNISNNNGHRSSGSSSRSGGSSGRRRVKSSGGRAHGQHRSSLPNVAPPLASTAPAVPDATNRQSKGATVVAAARREETAGNGYGHRGSAPSTRSTSASGTRPATSTTSARRASAQHRSAGPLPSLRPHSRLTGRMSPDRMSQGALDPEVSITSSLGTLDTPAMLKVVPANVLDA